MLKAWGDAVNTWRTYFLIALATLLIIGVNMLLGFVLASQSKSALKVLLDTRMLDITNTAANLLNGDELQDLKAEDNGTEKYQRIYDTLLAFYNDADLRYIYCIRDMGGKRFVLTVDATSEEPEEFGTPVAYTDALYKASVGTAAADDEPCDDEWGRFYSAYSPVFDSSGRVAGIVGADFSADWYEEQIATQRKFIEICIFVSTLICLFLIWMVAKRTKELETVLHVAEELNKQLSSISNIYMSMYDVDIDEDCFTEIKSIRSYRSKLIKAKEKGADAMMKGLARKASKPVMQEDLSRFTAIDTLKERLMHTETIVMEFLDKESSRWVRARFIVSKRGEDGVPNHVLLLEEDIDKEKKARDKLIDSSERAIAANEAKSEFLSIMSHDIRTPINVVLGMNEMILRECRNQSIIDYAENIKAAGSTLLGLINNILDFSKIEAGKMELMPVAYDLFNVLKDLVNMTQTQAVRKGLVLSLDFDKETPKKLFGDELRIKQVITNILTNAVKYTSHGSVIFSVGFERIEEEPNNVLLCVSVKDTGIGIKPEDMEKLFREFERIDEKRNRKVEGTGLGMAITQSLLDMMGTRLKVESRYGLGSKFSFRLKQKVVSWEPLGDYETSQRIRPEDRKLLYREKFTAPRARVLVVDDNPMNLMVFKSLLKQTLVEIDTADSADGGLRLTAEKEYDIIFLDHMMPGKDGIEMLHELRSQGQGLNSETTAICLTANAVFGAREQYISAGFDDYLTKPIDSGKLEDMLLACLPVEKLEAPVTEEAATEPEGAHVLPDVLVPLEGQDWLDLALGIKNSGSVEAYLPLLRTFYESLDEKADELDGFYNKGSLKEYTIKVHAMKSSARLIGAREFGEEAQKLEHAGACGDMEYIRAHHGDFIAMCRGFKTPLSEVFQPVEPRLEKPEADERRMKGIYAELWSAAEDMDCDRLEGIFAEMENYRIPVKEASLWNLLKKASEQYDYEKILSLLPQMDG